MHIRYCLNMKTIEDSIKSIKDFDFKNATQKQIEEILPYFGMNDEQTFELPKEFNEFMGWGIKFWQYPNQLSKLLCFLRNKDIDSYLEIGVRWGGTFILVTELLRRYNSHLRVIANDIIPQSEILHIYQNDFEADKFSYIQMGSNDPFFLYNIGNFEPKPTPQIDCVFIDGNHQYWSAKEDYLRALHLGAKYIIFHDIVSQSCVPTKILWKDLKKKHRKTYEFTDQYESVNGTYLGIGVIEITNEDDCFPTFEEFYPYL